MEKPRFGDGLLEFNARLEGLAEAGNWQELVESLTDLDLLANQARAIGPLAIRTGSPLKTFLAPFLNEIPPEYKSANQKLAHMADGLDDFSAALELHFAREAGSLDPLAKCQDCGSQSIVHGDVDLGATADEYNNYFSLCTNCFWSWHDEQVSRSGSSDTHGIFDYATNQYIGYS